MLARLARSKGCEDASLRGDVRELIRATTAAYPSDFRAGWSDRVSLSSNNWRLDPCLRARVESFRFAATRFLDAVDGLDLEDGDAVAQFALDGLASPADRVEVLLQDQRDWLTARWSRAAGGAAPEPRRVRDHLGPEGRAFESGTASAFADPAECADFDGEGEAARWYRSKNALFIPLLAEAGAEGALGVVVFSNRLHDDQQTPTPELADELAMTAEDDAALRDEVTYVAPGDAMRTIYATPFSPRDEAALAGFVDFLGLVYAFTQRNNDKGQRSENSRVAAHKRERRKSRDDIRDRSLSKFVDGVEWASTATELFGADAFGSLKAAPARAPPEVARAFARWKAAS